MPQEPLAVYFHWPYCKSKCPYCDFFKHIQKDVPKKEITDLYLKELEYYHGIVPSRKIRSVFFGGGTPSLMDPADIERLLDKIFALWPSEKNVEITLEANPNTDRENMFSEFKSAGINRLSLGVQALNEPDLRFLGRTHTLPQALKSIETVLKVFENHSMDLIYARPNQTPESWQNELEQAVSFGFRHLSLYQLTIEDGTVFAKRNIRSADEDTAVKMYQNTVDYLRTAGYPRYEVSNFAPSAFESTHNKCYWTGDDYIGIGESAHGRLKIDSKHFALTHPHCREELTTNERAEELILMGLRLQQGINKTHFYQICGKTLDSCLDLPRLKELIDSGWLEDTPDSLKATDRGFLVLDRLIEELCA